MHMADALISPTVGVALTGVTAGLISYCVKKIKDEDDNKKIPLMGVLGAFVFATQMINFAIPFTGSSGHLGGGMLLAVLLGPYAGFLTMASVLLIQALFFADGGLLAYGCNVFNLSFYTSFIAYPLIFKAITKKGFSTKRLFIASLLSSIIGLQLGAFSVVLQTVMSFKTELPFYNFLNLMQPVHLAIGIVEGIATFFVVSFVYKFMPQILDNSKITFSYKKIIIIFIILIIIIGGFVSWFASQNPDGLEWSINKVSGQAELETNDSLHKILEHFQGFMAIMPDYSFKTNLENNQNENLATTTSGILGSATTLILITIIGLILNYFKKANYNKHQ